MIQIPRIIEVKPQENMTLFVRFENGDKKEMDAVLRKWGAQQ
jgi:hypothetical protein